MKISDNNINRSSNNFDALRLIAASLVVIGHSSAILLNKPLEADVFNIIFGIPAALFGVIIFFIISGFLVARSWENKKDVLDFLLARVLRIFPAAIVVVLLSVFVLGIAMTYLPVSEYLASGQTHRYLQNITLYRMYYYLPGVFESNPSGPSVNGSLWTLPYEFTCYLLLICAGVFSLLKNKWAALSIFLILCFSYLFFSEPLDKVVIPVIGIDFKNFYMLMLYFFAGALYYLFRHDIVFSFSWLLIAAANYGMIKFTLFPELLYVIIIPYLVLFFAFSKRIILNKVGKRGDFSYGLFLYSYPVQQLIVYLMPVKTGLFVMIILSLLFTLPFAVLSWIFIESPALNLRKKINLLHLKR